MTSQQPAAKRAATSFMARQFGRPSGPAGRLVTLLLARGNDRFNRWLVHELPTAVPAPRTVIELGCGPGIALHQLLLTYPNARVTGVDHSTVALKSARRRNARTVAAGRLKLVTGDTRTLIMYGPADLVVACHVLYFWTDPVNELRQIRDAPSRRRAASSTTQTTSSPQSWTPPGSPARRFISSAITTVRWDGWPSAARSPVGKHVQQPPPISGMAMHHSSPGIPEPAQPWPRVPFTCRSGSPERARRTSPPTRCGRGRSADVARRTSAEPSPRVAKRQCLVW